MILGIISILDELYPELNVKNKLKMQFIDTSVIAAQHDNTGPQILYIWK